MPILASPENGTFPFFASAFQIQTEVLEKFGLFPEEIGVGARAHQVQFVVMNSIDNEPISFEMYFAITFPASSQWMVSIVFGQWFLPDQGR